MGETFCLYIYIEHMFCKKVVWNIPSQPNFHATAPGNIIAWDLEIAMICCDVLTGVIVLNELFMKHFQLVKH